MENLIDTTFGSKRIAMLIDGENAQSSLIDKMVAETGKYGLVTVRRIYGDWTTPQMKSWKEILNTHAIQPIQQFRYTIGKNSSDASLIIDAMDILYEGTVHGFCLVSSDSDYTRLATRIREKGLFVMGIGGKTRRPHSSKPARFLSTRKTCCRKNRLSKSFRTTRKRFPATSQTTRCRY